jgi:anti-sigma factor RsiW
MTPERARHLVHAYIDGERDADSTMALEAQMKESPALRLEFERLSALQNLVRSRASRFDAPSRLGSRVFPTLPEVQPGRITGGVPAWWRSVAVGASITAAALLLWTLAPVGFRGGDSAIPVGEVVSAHARSLMADHLTDLTSAERHTVKPWLSSRLDFAPPVQDLAGEGFALVGARLDYLGGRPVAAVVYRYRQHIINVFVWPSAENQENAVRPSALKGYNTVRFDDRGMSFWAVSDLNPEDLGKLANLLQRAPQ